MKKTYLTLLFAMGSLTQVFAQTSIWTISGHDPQWGKYDGSLSIQILNGESIATRQILFKNRKYRSLSLEEVWQGPVTAESGQRSVKFDVQMSSHVSSYGENKQGTRPDEKFKMLLPMGENSVEWKFLDRKESLTPSTSARPSLKIGETSFIESADRPTGTVSSIARMVARRFYDLPSMQPHLDKKEFKRGLHFVERDSINYDFYQTKPKTLRMVDEWATDFSATGEFLRYDAYAYSLTEKAVAQDSRMQEVMIDSFGLISHPHLDSNGKLLGHEGELSSALWTGIYVLSQSWRYEATGDGEALKNIKRSLKGLLTLAEIHDEPLEFARSLRTVGDSWQDIEDKHWRRASDSYGNIEYHDRGNNDMLRGLVLGLLVAHESLPDLSLTDKARIVKGLKRLVNSRIAQKRVSNELYAMGALAIVERTPENLRSFDQVHGKWRRSLGNLAPALKGSGIITDWSGNFLGLVADVLLEKVFSELKPEALKPLLEKSHENWEDTKLLRPTPHTFFLASMRAKYPQVGKNISSESIEDARWNLREMLREKPGFDFAIDQSLKSDFIPSPYPALFWKFINREEGGGEERMLSLVAKPVFKSIGADHMQWRLSPFGFEGLSKQGQPRAGTDYLFAYWMARRFGVISAQE